MFTTSKVINFIYMEVFDIGLTMSELVFYYPTKERIITSHSFFFVLLFFEEKKKH